jgi:hypothetical protein
MNFGQASRVTQAPYTRTSHRIVHDMGLYCSLVERVGIIPRPALDSHSRTKAIVQDMIKSDTRASLDTHMSSFEPLSLFSMSRVFLRSDFP